MFLQKRQKAETEAKMKKNNVMLFYFNLLIVKQVLVM
jgi:hypothetical protein